MNWLSSVTLQGNHAILEPMGHEHHDGLCQATADGQLSKLWYAAVPSSKNMRAEIERRLDLQKRGTMLPFTVRHLASGNVVGMTTYMNVDGVNCRVQIGSTWYAKSVQRTVVNTECKYMLLRHAFETLDVIAVEFRTHFFNHQSRHAIERLGAKQDGILRNHMRMPNGTLRDTIVYSILPSEWPVVKTHLEAQLARQY